MKEIALFDQIKKAKQSVKAGNKVLFLYFFNLVVLSGYAQDVYERNEFADVRNYRFDLSLNDENDEIHGVANILVDFKKEVDTFSLDLVSHTGLYGMKLTQVLENTKKANYTYKNNRIYIIPDLNDSLTSRYKIKYQGIPEKGLVIDTTKYGQRAFFGDNWPNLARHWLPCVDHPYDKASVEFHITAPEYYDVVATGKKTEESNLGNGLKLTTYVEDAPVAVKVVTIGVARFAHQILGNVGDTEVSTWVYPENRLKGFSDFREAKDILEYFVNQIGPYSYSKLANIQAKTRWGGLENAGTITYDEKLITGEQKNQELIAHEIAHQWFGNSVTENSWNHVWLSEGFATYFAVLYLEAVHGSGRRKQEMTKDRKEIFEYYLKNPSPIIDLSIKNPEKVLNINTYQKAGWMLHMLRHQLGDKLFWEGIRDYYTKYQNKNVMSSDFQKTMEQVSGKNLQEYFDQWLFIKGYPQLKWTWKYKKGKVRIAVKQKQKQHTFKFPLEFGLTFGGQTEIHTIEIDENSEKFEIKVDAKPQFVRIDPDGWLLFEEI